jgi:hypothetical protein
VMLTLVEDPVDSSHVDALRNEFIAIRDEAIAFFADVRVALGPVAEFQTHEWNILNPEQQETAQKIRKKVTEFGPRLLEAVRESPLMEQVDAVELRRFLRKLSAALQLRHYQYAESYPITEEDRVFGIVPAQQRESAATAEESSKRFKKYAQRILAKMDFIAPSPENLTRAIVSSQIPGVHKYRPNTAFIMMSIDKGNPALEDVKNTIKEVFKSFGIEAVRSDEIEHSDVITQRILDELSTSEFLIADLTGERPSVYYEVGYAHALGKRPILYRSEGTVLHFDLVVHNVPEYRNNTDLKSQLKTRLLVLTNKTPKE